MPTRMCTCTDPLACGALAQEQASGLAQLLRWGAVPVYPSPPAPVPTSTPRGHTWTGLLTPSTAGPVLCISVA